jgi:hypothetical protein
MNRAVVAPRLAQVRAGTRSLAALGQLTGFPKQKSPPRPEPGGQKGGPLLLLVDSIRALASLGLEGFDGVPGLFHGAGHEAPDGVGLMPTSA